MEFPRQSLSGDANEGKRLPAKLQLCRALLLVFFLYMLLPTSGKTSEIKIFGFFDLEAEVSNKDAEGKRWTFDQHHFNFINVYQLDKSFRVYGEIEFEHGASIEKDNLQGKVYLVNGFLDYRYIDALQVRAGKFTTPFGIYNERHDATPTFLFTKLPHSIYGNHSLSVSDMGRRFAKFSTGIQFLGQLYYGGWEGKYQVYLSNGRGGKSSETDDNSNKGVGFRLSGAPPGGDINIGVSYYSDRNGNDLNTRQRALGLDISFDHSNLILESELLLFSLEQVDSSLKPNDRFVNGLGSSSMLAYRVRDRWTPFIRFEFDAHNLDMSGDESNILSVGLNLAVSSRVYLKSELHFHELRSSGKKKYTMFVSSIAAAF